MKTVQKRSLFVILMTAVVADYKRDENKRPDCADLLRGLLAEVNNMSEAARAHPTFPGPRDPTEQAVTFLQAYAYASDEQQAYGESLVERIRAWDRDLPTQGEQTSGPPQENN